MSAGVLSHAVQPGGQPAPEFGYHAPGTGCPVYQVPGSGAEIWLLRTRAAVLAALRSPAIRDLHAITPRHALAGVTLQRPGGLLRRTGTDAESLRALLNPTWRRTACEPLRPVLRRLAARRAAALTDPGTSPADLAAAFIRPYIGDLIILAAGMSGPAEAAALTRLSDWTTGTLLYTPADHAPVQAAWDQLYDFTAAALSRACTSPPRRPGAPALQILEAAGLPPAGPSLLVQSALALERAGLPPAEVCEAVTTIYNGLPTTAPALTRITAELLDRPAALAACRTSPALARAAVAEAIRRTAHFTFALPGLTQAPVILDRTAIPAGTAVLPVIHAAEHDPALRRPGRRQPLPTLAWGAGTHTCLGRHLATIALEEAIIALANANIRPAGPPTRWRPGTMPTPHTLHIQP